MNESFWNRLRRNLLGHRQLSKLQPRKSARSRHLQAEVVFSKRPTTLRKRFPRRRILSLNRRIRFVTKKVSLKRSRSEIWREVSCGREDDVSQSLEREVKSLPRGTAGKILFPKVTADCLTNFDKSRRDNSWYDSPLMRPRSETSHWSRLSGHKKRSSTLSNSEGRRS